MQNLQFDNSFARSLPADPDTGPHRRQVHGALYSRVRPTPVSAPKLLAWSPETAALVALTAHDVESPRFAEIFGGNGLLEGMEPFAANYGGHQFGNWAGQLGDGRAINLGEVVNAAGERWELQLKGAGPTPYSRTADGRAVLRSSVREFLCSEAMHHLGVPTTRALSLVATGDEVVRDMFYDGRPRAEPGAIVCRVAPSFVRFGNFELPASRGDVPLLERLVDFVIRRDFPELVADGADPSAKDVRVEWFARVCERTARMVVHWQRVGFVHGVMNTDNMSILGLTIDYGPYGWVDDFDPDWTPNTTDAHGRRYRFGQQPQVAHWNLVQLANALMPLVQDVQPLADGLDRFVAEYERAWRGTIAAKLGLVECRDEDVGLMESLQEWMHAAEVDMTLFFRALSAADPAVRDPMRFAQAFYDDAKAAAEQPRFDAWWARFAQRVGQEPQDPVARRGRMEAANPRFVLRNYLAQQVIDQAEQGDPSGIAELLDVLRRPYDEQPGRGRFGARRPDWARNRPGCSMLSCSS